MARNERPTVRRGYLTGEPSTAPGSLFAGDDGIVSIQAVKEPDLKLTSAPRHTKNVSAVIYGAQQEPSLIALDPRVVLRELKRGGWRSRLYEIEIGGNKTRALMRDVQLHPVTDQPEHVDFMRLLSGEPVRVSVAVRFLNRSVCPGLKHGGVLHVVRREIDVEVDPEHIPTHFDVDLTDLNLNDSIRWHNLKGTQHCKPLIAERDFLVAAIAPSTSAGLPKAPVASVQHELDEQDSFGENSAADNLELDHRLDDLLPKALEEIEDVTAAYAQASALEAAATARLQAATRTIEAASERLRKALHC